MTQNFLDLNNDINSELIYSYENQNIVSVLQQLKENLVFILGSKKSGKTTLAKKFSLWHKALIISNDKELVFNKKQLIYFIDENIFNFNRESLFHFIQNIITHNYHLYFFLEPIQDNIKTGLSDLDSRLSLFTRLTISEPDAVLMKELLKKHLKQRQVRIDDSIIDELPNIIDRSYESVYNCSNDINRLLYQNNHNINLRLIREFYNAI